MPQQLSPASLGWRYALGVFIGTGISVAAMLGLARAQQTEMPGPLSPSEVAALAEAAKRQITDQHCTVLVDTFIERVGTPRGQQLVTQETRDQVKMIFRNGGHDVTCSGSPRVILVGSHEEAGLIGAAITKAGQRAGVNFWNHYGFMIGLRPAGVGQKTSDARPALK